MLSIEQLGMPLLGGVLIGLSASLLLFCSGRVFGISGILASILSPKKGETMWRVAALLGLFTAGIILRVCAPELLLGELSGSMSRYLIAGVLVGFGTQLGSGCTSGHGVCGISRMSPRSIAATVVFILAGIITVAVIRLVWGGL